jgi:hypothetical protein
MTEKTENTDKGLSAGGLKSILAGSILESDRATKLIPFIIFIAFLGILLITNRYYTEQTIREIEMVRDSLKEYKSESVIHETELMYINRPSEVAKKVIERKIDLIEPVEPARKIKVKKLTTE